MQKQTYESIVGKVISSTGRGKKLGYPTANLDILPKNLQSGIYACTVEAEIGKFAGVLFFGLRKTFGDTKPSVEVHLFDFTGDLLGKKLTVTPRAFLRKPQKFATEGELRQAIIVDCEKARCLLSSLKLDYLSC